MKEITSINNEFIKTLTKLKESKYRKTQQMFLVEGYHLVEEAHKSNRLKCVLITNVKDEIKGIDNYLTTPEIIKKLSTTITPQPIIGVCSVVTKDTITDKILLLDNIQDPGNLGTIIRTSLGFNIKTIVLSPNTVDEYNEKVIRSSQGSIFKTSIIRCDLLDFIDKHQDITYVTTTLNGQPLNEVIVPNKYGIILGNEGNGISSEILDKIHNKVTIPMNNELESFNVSIACAIILYHFSQNQK